MRQQSVPDATTMTAPVTVSRASGGRARASAKRRQFVTPEGVDLSLEIASAGLRFAALIIDLFMMAGILILMAITLGITGITGLGGRGDMLAVIGLLGFFLLRNFWFLSFELGPRAATPGKRLVGIRVVARDGGRLDVPAVVARNFVREVELFLPITFLASAGAEDMLDNTLAILGLVWTLALSLFLLFNKDRMRLGDLIGGTWVVVARRGKMAIDLSTVGDQAHAENQFSDAELGVYGIYELQELERVLRERDAKVMRSVADTIRGKIGRPQMGDDATFLIAYYRQLKAKLERDLLFGKRREDKYAA
jgi:uncharacterized RDD family membrane protein YckC